MSVSYTTLADVIRDFMTCSQTKC